ncbi:MAG: GDYXXLXY domain-containing protein [Hyphomicrobium sp.]|nr:GDYXXLXY domain-containing protein [Hyphomicrobium sp.]
MKNFTWSPMRQWATLLVVAGLQSLVLASMVWGRANLLANGREVVLEVVPVDPRDIFRGEYVILGYKFMQPGDAELPQGTQTGDKVFVTLTRATTADKDWTVKSIAPQHPGAAGTEDVVLKATVSDIYHRAPEDVAAGKPPRGRLRFGIESYFVPEGQGKVLEEQVREGRIEAVVAVGTDGTAALKALIIDGKRVVEEPLI